MSAITGRNVVTIARGEAKTLRITIDNPPNAGIAGWDFEFLLYAAGDLSTPILTKTTGFTVVDSADTFELLMAASDTSDLAPGVYPYKVRQATTNIRIAFGPLIVSV